MAKVIIKRTFKLGKVAAYGTRKINRVTIELELRRCGGEPTFTVAADGTRNYTGKRTPEYDELSICGNVWNGRGTDIIMGGQCLDEIKRLSNQMTDRNRKLFHTLYDLWRNFHLNGMKVGTPEQEASVAEWESKGYPCDYRTVCEMLMMRGLYRVRFTGITVGKRYQNELYTYGHGWVVKELPSFVYKAVARLVAEPEI